ncbi:FAD:protein FMN transferase [Hoeflea alexandrii]|uniref:FAD:protein FMN transferase n=1 Tax=Hoeflea alexandrii TaxID=288436 RepID=UPI00226D49FB|nr:FAD:protein FMN transferase [Hoeflea alexandrii]MCY0154919.1 FAD:protein FMN transferase [Hoeflea alexandrii]
MSFSRRRFIAIAAGCVLAAKPGSAAPVDGARWRGVALGAETDLRIVGMPRAQAEYLIGVARAEIERLEKQFSLYRQDSALVSLNGDGFLRDPSPDMLELLSLAGSVHEASDGMFDPTIQPLWKAYAESGGWPGRASIRRALERVGWNMVEVSLGACPAAAWRCDDAEWHCARVHYRQGRRAAQIVWTGACAGQCWRDQRSWQTGRI